MKYVYILIGIVAFLLGFIGTLLPILPTTPFLLLSVFCFARGSKKLDTWLCSTSLYKKHIESFITHRAMERETKVRLMIFASVMLMIAFFMMNNILGKLFIISLILFKFYYFKVHIKTIQKENR